MASGSGGGEKRVFPPPPATEQLSEADSETLVATGTIIHANPNDPIHYGSGGVQVFENVGEKHADWVAENALSSIRAMLPNEVLADVVVTDRQGAIIARAGT